MQVGHGVRARLSLCIILLHFFVTVPAYADQWSFAAIADNRAEFSSYRNVLEEIARSAHPGMEESPSVELVLALGDVDPVRENFEIYRETFNGSGPVYLPVRGNHERSEDVQYIRSVILPLYKDFITVRNGNGINYYADWKKVRLIVLDQYSEFGRSFENQKALKWIENAIETAANTDHIFIAFHEPYLPGNALDDPFWNLLLKHKEKIRAVLWGHTHTFSRRNFPEGESGILCIDAGNAGRSSHSDDRQTIVQVTEVGGDVLFRAVQAPDKTKEFKVTDQWEIRGVHSDKNRGPKSYLDATRKD